MTTVYELLLHMQIPRHDSTLHETAALPGSTMCVKPRRPYPLTPYPDTATAKLVVPPFSALNPTNTVPDPASANAGS